MNILLIHQNFPGQFRNLFPHLRAAPGITTAVLAEHKKRIPQGVRYSLYAKPKPGSPSAHYYLRDLDGQVRRGQAGFRAMAALRDEGFAPDVVVAHPGWGECLFVRDVFPDAKLLYYLEWYYRSTGSDMGFDPEFPSTMDDTLRARMRNATQLFSLADCDAGISPTAWQRAQYPEALRRKITVLHDGVDTQAAAPNPTAGISWPEQGVRLTPGDEVVTFVARNLEPYRGFHTFLRAVPHIVEARPNCHILIVGGDEVSYGKHLPAGQTYRAKYMAETGLASDRVHFLGRLPYGQFLKVLQVSAVHIYLTYPFVLSWSLLEAMACGCVVLGSRSPPVQEVIREGENGFLADFFDAPALARQAAELLARRADLGEVRAAARRTILDRYDLATICLPAQVKLIRELAQGR